ncbi:MAG: transposase [Deltaproteobacteria bacterium]|nr:transposase [Deltaproteobacteria bacterium]
MPRHPRVHAPGLLFHVMARGNNGQKVFLGPADYEAFSNCLRNVGDRYPHYLYAYVLMPNHFHLLMEVSDAPTARIMQSLLTGYVRGFNRTHGRKGHLFQGRYKAIVCERDSYLLELVRYIHLNPVRAGLVRRPGEWKWSGHGEYLRKEKRRLIDPGPVMEELRTVARYEAFVRDGIKQGYQSEWHPGDSKPFLGVEGFVDRVVKGRKETSSRRPVAMETLCKQVAKEEGFTAEALRGRGRSASLAAARRQFIWQAVFEEGYEAAKVAQFLRCHASNVSRVLQRTASDT